MTLRLAWLGPWNNRSAIASFGAHVAAALVNQGHIVDIYRTEVGEESHLPALPWITKIRNVSDVGLEALSTHYDAVVANIGDHFGFHGALAQVLPYIGTIMICHDAFMANFCSGWAQLFDNPSAALQTMICAAYGEHEFERQADFWLPEAAMVERRPMIELFARQAIAAVVHATHYQRRVENVCPGPVVNLPLVVRKLYLPPVRPVDGLLRIATIGNANSNKRIGEVIKAIGRSERLGRSCRYRIIGMITPDQRAALEIEMEACGFGDVEFTGWVSDTDLCRLLSDTDVICCLRHPVLEGGSGSVIEAMSAGRAVLVSDQGVYAELPDDTVLKCRPGAEADDVQRYLLALVNDSELIQKYGTRARNHAMRINNPAEYARALSALVVRACHDLPVIETSKHFGRILGSIGIDAADAAVARLARALAVFEQARR